MSEQHEEITLGTGRLLGLFFGLVIICALFFSVGFTLGRRSAPETSTSASGTVAEAKMTSSRAETANKPDADAAPKSSTDELTFYKAVEQNEPKAKLDPPPLRVAPVSARTVESKPVETRRAAIGAGYMVQVAAVRKQEDAEALVRALRRKSYPVVNAAGAGDKLYHVQVGPFADLKGAEATRAKLVGDGYNPIVKK